MCWSDSLKLLGKPFIFLLRISLMVDQVCLILDVFLSQTDQINIYICSPSLFSLEYFFLSIRRTINNIPAMAQVMAWCRLGDKPLSEPMMVSLLTQICVTRPQKVKNTRIKNLSISADIDFEQRINVCGVCNSNNYAYQTFWCFSSRPRQNPQVKISYWICDRISES